ncbi:hypothetical protein GCM10010145_24060 [Streptomyces ruber]|uniref:Secreted protein n=2 Tax=Streptomyces TaxID=1883 RepID=A0A918ESD6_9ACTN|nr:hypothetical protein GCM10010145_24060 [Streptomyces ruber]
MRTLLTFLLAWLLPSTGRHRAPSHPPLTAPRHARRPLPTPCSPYSLDLDTVIHADGLPLVRPYLTHRAAAA